MPETTKPLMTRRQIAAYLRANGFPIGDGTLMKLCAPAQGEGPPVAAWLGNRALHDPDVVIEWRAVDCDQSRAIFPPIIRALPPPRPVFPKFESYRPVELVGPGGATVLGAGQQFVSPGGLASGTTISAGSFQAIVSSVGEPCGAEVLRRRAMRVVDASGRGPATNTRRPSAAITFSGGSMPRLRYDGISFDSS
jgi:autotransporter passenger strand-loop-strand repeat protein